MSDSSALDAALAGELAACYAYGVIGGQSSGAWQRRATRALAAHEARRDDLQQRVGSQAVTPAAFDLPFPVTDGASARRLAVTVEERLVGLYADLAVATRDAERAAAVSAGMDSATRAITWGGRPEAFPGS